MGKKKRVKEVKETKKTVIILCVVGLFLVGIILLQAFHGFRRLDLQRCILRMVAIKEAMKKMQEETGFKFDLKQHRSKDLLNSLVIYFQYGERAFYKDQQGYLERKPVAELKKLPMINRDDNFFPEYPECPGGGEYRLVPVEGTNLFNVLCSRHGGIEEPDEKGRYVYEGDFARLGATQIEFGLQARIIVPAPYKIGKEVIFLVPKPRAKRMPAQAEETSPTLGSNIDAEKPIARQNP